VVKLPFRRDDDSQRDHAEAAGHPWEAEAVRGK
jgi:hypothetical protein